MPARAAFLEAFELVTTSNLKRKYNTYIYITCNWKKDQSNNHPKSP